ncbi:MAG TPA: hypothetical protein PLU35_03710 [Phycisphaerales bacterium]|nr:hypothetical protein [Phycisphaerales bacterium]
MTPRGTNSTRTGAVGRPWLGVRFECAGVYVRVYRNPNATAYLAQCPCCGRSVRFRVGPGGTAERFFTVNCGPGRYTRRP